MSKTLNPTQSISIENTFKRIHDRLLVKTNMQETIKNYQFLFERLVNQFNFRSNKYICQGSFDLSSWVVYCFSGLLESNEDMFRNVLLLIAYLSIVDDALDEEYNEESIEEMKKHLEIFLGHVNPDENSNPAINMAQTIVEFLNSNDSCQSIKKNSIQFFQTGITLLRKGILKSQNQVDRKNLYQFLEERRIDSMAKLFIDINMGFKNLQVPSTNPIFVTYSNLGCDIISLINDIASHSKDLENKVTNNYLLLHYSMKNNIPVSELTKLIEYEQTLDSVLKTIEKLMSRMNIISTIYPQLEKEFQSVDEIVKGYCTWCFTSKRFVRNDHILDHFKSSPNSNNNSEKSKSLFKFQDQDNDTYFADMKKYNNHNL